MNSLRERSIMDLFEPFERLVLAHGPPGMEDEVRELIAEEVKDLADELLVDRLGNLIARRGSGGPRVMIEAHMDEVGLVVRHIDDDGWVWFARQGGANERLLEGQRVTILTGSGRVPGVVGAKGRHLLNQEDVARTPPVEDMWIDVGAGSAEEAAGLGVGVGDLCTFEKRFQRLGGGDLVCATSVDDRAGCLAVMEAFRTLGDADAAVYAVFSVQEEVGCRGARTAAFQIDPDVAIVVDTSYGLDPATSTKETTLHVGRGPAIRAWDRRHTVPRRIYDLLISTAEEEGIPYQPEVAVRGATDASTVHLVRGGVPTGQVLIARRYSHSPVEVVSMGDIRGATSLLASAVTRIDSGFVEGLVRRIK